MFARLAPVALVALPFFAAACSGGDTMDNGVDQSADELGKTKYHYEPGVSDVHFNSGCGVIQNPPQQDCSYGFAMKYTKSYIDLQTTVSHQTDNVHHTVKIKVDTWSYSQIHPMVMVGPQEYDLGLLDAKVGTTYKVTVVDRKDKVLWSGNVATLYHL